MNKAELLRSMADCRSKDKFAALLAYCEETPMVKACLSVRPARSLERAMAGFGELGLPVGKPIKKLIDDAEQVVIEVCE